MSNLERGEPKVRIRPMEHEDMDSILAIDRKITGVRRAVTYTELITGDLGGVLDLSIVAEVIMTKSFLAYIPAGMKHCPLIVRKVEKPIFHFTVGLGGEYVRGNEK